MQNIQLSDLGPLERRSILKNLPPEDVMSYCLSEREAWEFCHHEDVDVYRQQFWERIQDILPQETEITEEELNFLYDWIGPKCFTNLLIKGKSKTCQKRFEFLYKIFSPKYYKKLFFPFLSSQESTDLAHQTNNCVVRFGTGGPGVFSFSVRNPKKPEQIDHYRVQIMSNGYYLKGDSGIGKKLGNSLEEVLSPHCIITESAFAKRRAKKTN